MEIILFLLLYVIYFNLITQSSPYHHDLLSYAYSTSLSSISGGISSQSDVSLVDSISPSSFKIMILWFAHYDAYCPNPWHLKHLISQLRFVCTSVLDFCSVAKTCLFGLPCLKTLRVTIGFDNTIFSLSYNSSSNLNKLLVVHYSFFSFVSSL